MIKNIILNLNEETTGEKLETKLTEVVNSIKNENFYIRLIFNIIAGSADISMMSKLYSFINDNPVLDEKLKETFIVLDNFFLKTIINAFIQTVPKKFPVTMETNLDFLDYLEE